MTNNAVFPVTDEKVIHNVSKRLPKHLLPTLHDRLRDNPTPSLSEKSHSFERVLISH
jgi:hypothetical protein